MKNPRFKIWGNGTRTWRKNKDYVSIIGNDDHMIRFFAEHIAHEIEHKITQFNFVRPRRTMMEGSLGWD